MPVLLPARATLPRYSWGYAHSAGESAYPGLWEGLVGAWVPALGVTGNTLRDVSAHGLNGTLVNMDPPTDWIISGDSLLPGYSLDFDGSDDRVKIETSSVVDNLPQFSIIAWIKPALVDADDRILEKEAGTAGWHFTQTSGGAGRYQTQITFASVFLRWQAAITVGNGILRQVASVWNGSSSAAEQDHFENGVRLAHVSDQDASGARDDDSAQDIFIGARGGTSLHYTGSVSALFLWNRPLVPSEIILDLTRPLALLRRRRRIISAPAVAVGGRIMSSLVGAGGLAGMGGIAGQGGGLAA